MRQEIVKTERESGSLEEIWENSVFPVALLARQGKTTDAVQAPVV